VSKLKKKNLSIFSSCLFSNVCHCIIAFFYQFFAKQFYSPPRRLALIDAEFMQQESRVAASPAARDEHNLLIAPFSQQGASFEPTPQRRKLPAAVLLNQTERP
jgi:hypothetical protein